MSFCLSACDFNHFNSNAEKLRDWNSEFKLFTAAVSAGIYDLLYIGGKDGRNILFQREKQAAGRQTHAHTGSEI